MVQWDTEEIIGAILGGILISLATTLNYFLYGKSEGMHGIFHSLFLAKRKHRRGENIDFLKKTCFLFGIVTLPFLILRGVFENVVIVRGGPEIGSPTVDINLFG